MEAVASGDEIAGDLVTLSANLIVNYWVRFEAFDAHRFRFKIQRRAVPEARTNQILDDLLLRINGDGFAHQLLKIDAMALPVKAQLDAFVFQTFAFQALAHSGIAQDVNRTLFEYPGPDPCFHIFAGLAFQHDRLDALQMQQVCERQPRRPRSDNPDLCANFCHLAEIWRWRLGEFLDHFRGYDLPFPFGRVARQAHGPYSFFNSFNRQGCSAKELMA
jgi:hypothetical protein